MLQVLIIGGKLQGTEVTYLAKKAGYHTVVVDRRKQAPAFGLADEAVSLDVTTECEKMIALFLKADVVIPAVEKEEVLEKILEYGEIANVPVVFDKDAYHISSSKQLSNALFEKLLLPMPGKYPECSYPVIIKPDGLSGSTGVRKAFSKEEAEKILDGMEADAVVQEFLEGRSFSLEVISDGKQFYFPQITEVVIDKDYDCKRIIAPAQLSKDEEEQFYQIGTTLVKALKIKGIFDIEVICHNGILKLLEIDARFPSQTPISVYHSTGINMVAMLVELALGQRMDQIKKYEKVCYYQQIQVKADEIRVIGEHILEDCKELSIKKGFFGATEGITDYQEGSNSFKAILIVNGETKEEAYHKFLNCIEQIKKKLGRQVAFIEG